MCEHNIEVQTGEQRWVFEALSLSYLHGAAGFVIKEAQTVTQITRIPPAVVVVCVHASISSSSMNYAVYVNAPSEIHLAVEHKHTHARS